MNTASVFLPNSRAHVGSGVSTWSRWTCAVSAAKSAYPNRFVSALIGADPHGYGLLAREQVARPAGDWRPGRPGHRLRASG